ncbi:hypothetical protein SARC_02802, partial [Sphaeroforma arctica JP610]
MMGFQVIACAHSAKRRLKTRSLTRVCDGMKTSVVTDGVRSSVCLRPYGISTQWVHYTQSSIGLRIHGKFTISRSVPKKSCFFASVRNGRADVPNPCTNLHRHYHSPMRTTANSSTGNAMPLETVLRSYTFPNNGMTRPRVTERMR